MNWQQQQSSQRPVYDSNFSVQSRLGLKNLEFEETLRQRQANPGPQELNGTYSQFNRKQEAQEKPLSQLLQEKNGDFFEEHFEESEESRIHFQEKDNDVNIVIRQSNRPILLEKTEVVQDKPVEVPPPTLLVSNIVQQKVEQQAQRQVKAGIAKVDQKEEALQIVSVDHQGSFQVNGQLLQVLQKYSSYRLAFACLAGQYRTGKSFLLNQLLDIKGRGFRVDSSTSACTQGLWMWTRPLLETHSNTCVFFLDSEGANSLEKGQSHDAKVFALSVLLSSLFMFNTVGCIDEKSISQLQLTSQLSKQIANAASADDVAPPFLWLLRDFVLEMRDGQNRRVDSNTYMENSLSDETSYNKATPQNRHVREALLGFFRQRHCMPLIRPVQEETDLQQLDSLPNHRLKPQFLDQVQQLRTKILQLAQPKTLKHQELSPAMFVSMAESFVELINQGAVPDIQTAWDYMQQSQCDHALQHAHHFLQEALQRAFSDDQPKNQDELYSLFKQHRAEATSQYQAALSSLSADNKHYLSYLAELHRLADELEGKLSHMNDQLSSQLCEELLNFASKDIKENLNQQQYQSGQIDRFTRDYNEFLEIYSLKSQGSQKLSILVKFLKQFTPFTYQTLMQNAGESSSLGNAELNALKQQLKDQEQEQQILKQQNSIYQQQLQEQENLLASKADGAGDSSALKKQVQTLKQTKVQNENKIVELAEQLKNAQQGLVEKQKQLDQAKKNQSACCVLF